jgi:hypothetical protein
MGGEGGGGDAKSIVFSSAKATLLHSFLSTWTDVNFPPTLDNDDILGGCDSIWLFKGNGGLGSITMVPNLIDFVLTPPLPFNLD